jgi:hypothetical protein
MDGKTLARIGAVVFVALAIAATAIEMNRPADRQDDPAPLARPRSCEIRYARNSSAVARWARPAGAIRPACAPGPRTAAGSWVSRNRPRPQRRPHRTHRRRCSRPRQLPRQTRTGAADMQGAGVIDHFLEVFTRYIDSGFGLLRPEVAFIATTLIVIDVTLAALFWSWGADEDIIARWSRRRCSSASSPTSSATGTTSPASSSRASPVSA